MQKKNIFKSFILIILVLASFSCASSNKYSSRGAVPCPCEKNDRATRH